MSVSLVFFEIKDYETIPIFIRRLKYETGTSDYTILSCSPVMGRGIQVLHLASKANVEKQVKVEALKEKIDELKDFLTAPKVIENKEVKKIENDAAWHGLRDLF